MTGHEFASRTLQMMTLSPGVSGPLTHKNGVLAANCFMLFKVTGQVLLKSVHDPLLEIPS